MANLRPSRIFALLSLILSDPSSAELRSSALQNLLTTTSQLRSVPVTAESEFENGGVVPLRAAELHQRWLLLFQAWTSAELRDLKPDQSADSVATELRGTLAEAGLTIGSADKDSWPTFGHLQDLTVDSSIDFLVVSSPWARWLTTLFSFFATRLAALVS